MSLMLYSRHRPRGSRRRHLQHRIPHIHPPHEFKDRSIIHFETWRLEWLEQVLAGKLAYPPRKAKLLRVRWEELGRVAAKRLLDRVGGLNGPNEVIQLVPNLFETVGYEYTSL
jgi:hypothetical protein